MRFVQLSNKAYDDDDDDDDKIPPVSLRFNDFLSYVCVYRYVQFNYGYSSGNLSFKIGSKWPLICC